MDSKQVKDVLQYIADNVYKYWERDAIRELAREALASLQQSAPINNASLQQPLQNLIKAIRLSRMSCNGKSAECEFAEQILAAEDALGGFVGDTQKFENKEDLIAWLDTLHAAEGDAVTNHKWEPAQRAIQAIRALQSQPAGKDAIRDIVAERERQKCVEGWTEAHDDEHDDRSMAQAARCYVEHYVGRSWLLEDYPDGLLQYQSEKMPFEWPNSWDESWWKPKNPRRDLVRAAALIVAEIERIDRAAIAAVEGKEKP